MLVIFYRTEFAPESFNHIEIAEPRLFRPLLSKALFVTAGLLIAFIFGAPIAEAAFIEVVCFSLPVVSILKK